MAPGNSAPFYRRVLRLLHDSGVEHLVGGAYGFAHYTTIERDTKDLDIFLRQRDLDAALAALNSAGYNAAVVYPHWLAKAYQGDRYVDLIYSSGNGVAAVDDGWFAHAPMAEVLGIATRVCPVEETIWSKAFVMERERYDGADIAHLLRCRSAGLDWQRLLGRFGWHWPVLMSYLVLFDFIYPDQRAAVPQWVRKEMARRWQCSPADSTQPSICYGTLLSREQFLADINDWGYQDARERPLGPMTADEIERWTPG